MTHCSAIGHFRELILKLVLMSGDARIYSYGCREILIKKARSEQGKMIPI